MNRIWFFLALCATLAIATPSRAARPFPGNDNDRPMNTVESVRRAINDMITQFGDEYPDGEAYLGLDALEQEPIRTTHGTRNSPSSVAKRSSRSQSSTISNSLLCAPIVFPPSATTS